MTLAGLALGVLLVVGGARVGVVPTGDDAGTDTSRAPLPKPPLDFVPNRGQWPAPARFVALNGPLAATFERDGVALHLGDRSARLEFEGASRRTTLVGERRRAGVYNFVVGDDPSRWRTRVPSYGSVLYRGLYDGVDVRFRQGRAALEYDVLVAPRASLDRLVVRASGASRLELARDGALVLHTAAGPLRQDPPVAWEVLPDGVKRPVESRFRLLDAHRYGFAAPGRDPSLPLVVDPGLEWSTFLGGAGDESVEGLELARDGSGDVVVAGQTWSPDFPHTNGRHTLVGGTPYVARLNSTGSALVYSTFFGGSGNHFVYDVALDEAGRPIVVGETTSEDFPTTPGAYDRTPPNGFNGDYDAYVIKFDAAGASVEWGTYLGGSQNTGPDAAWRVALDPAGNVVVAGTTHASDFPTTEGAYDRSVSSKDVFVTRLDPTGSTVTYSTFVGGGGGDEVYGMELDPSGFVNIVGKTSSFSTGVPAFPTTPDAFDSTYDGQADGYFARLRLDGAGSADLKYATFLGGAQYTDAITGVAVDPNDPSLVTVSGWTRSADFPTTPGALNRTHPLPIDSSIGVIARFRFGATNSLVWSTMFAGLGNYAEDVVVSSTGEPLIVGGNAGGDPPTTDGAFDRVPGGGFYGGSDGYAARLSADGTRIEYMTLLGGSEDAETAWRVAYVGGNTIVTAGFTNSPDFPTTPGAFDNVYGADGTHSDGGNSPGGVANDAFVAKLTLERAPGGDVTPPPAPALRGPAEGAAFTAPAWVTLDWSDVADPSGIEAYHYQVSPNPAFRNEGGLAGTFTEQWMPTSFALVHRSISNTGTMYWRVRALDKANNLGPWSAVRTFTVSDAQPAAQVVLESPPNGSRFAPGDVTFGWRHADRAQYYEFQADTRSDFGAGIGNGPRIWRRALTANRVTVSIAEGKYFWRVRASNQSLTDGAWSTVWQFEAKRGEAAAPVPSPGTSTGGAVITTEAAPVTWQKMENHVTAGGSTTMAVVLAAPAPAGGAVVALESNRPYLAQVPPSVTVPAGATTASFTVTATGGIDRNSSLLVAAEYAGVVQVALLTVVADALSPELYRLTVAGATGGTVSVGGGTTLTGRVEFSPGWVAPPGGRIVTLATSNPDLVQVPPRVIIPAGSTFADFTVTTQPVTTATNVAVRAARSRDFRVTLQLLPPDALTSLALNPTTVIGGDPSTGTVTLSAPASPGGVVVALASSDTRWATVPASVTVPAGATSADFTVTTNPNNSGQGQSSFISATAGGITKTASIQVNPPPPGPTVSSLALNPSSVTGGASSTGTVTVSGTVTACCVVVSLSSSNTAVATVPQSVTVPVGSASAQFTVTTSAVAASTPVTITASRGTSRSAVLTVNPAAAGPTLSSLALNPTSVTGGSASTGTVTLSGAAPSGGASVSLSSSNTAVATVPASVTVAAGATSAQFAVSTSSVASSTSVTISAAYGGATQTAALTVSPTATDTVSITRAEYDSGKRELRVEATSTISTATLRLYVTATNELIGTLRNDGGGRYSGQFTWSVNPVSVTVRSSLGGSATRTVAAR